MALVKQTLQAELTAIYEKGPTGNPDGLQVGIDTAKAYLNYCSAAQNQAGMTMVAMPGSATLGTELGGIYMKTSLSGTLTATKIASAFDNCLMTFMSTCLLYTSDAADE